MSSVNVKRSLLSYFLLLTLLTCLLHDKVACFDNDDLNIDLDDEEFEIELSTVNGGDKTIDNGSQSSFKQQQQQQQQLIEKQTDQLAYIGRIFHIVVNGIDKKVNVDNTNVKYYYEVSCG